MNENFSLEFVCIKKYYKEYKKKLLTLERLCANKAKNVAILQRKPKENLYKYM